MEYDYLLKYLIVGNSGTGKTSIISRYTDDTSTSGENFKTKTIKVNDKMVKQEIFDTVGERTKALSSGHYRGAHAVVIVFDVCNRNSFKDLKKWIDEVDCHAPMDVVIVIVGNKCDLASEIEVSNEEVVQYLNSRDSGVLKYFEVSAKNGNAINDVFYYLALEIITKRIEKILVNDYVDIRYQSSDHVFKFLIMGDRKVGKSSLHIKVLEKSTSKIRDDTNVYKTLLINTHNTCISIHTIDYINDINIIPINIHGIIMMFDISNQSSLQYLLQLYQNNTQYGQFIQSGKASILIGNKCDLESKRQVSYQNGINAANQLNCCKYLETSSKKSIDDNESGIYQLFYEISNHILNKKMDQSKLSKIDTNKPQNNIQSSKSLCILN